MAANVPNDECGGERGLVCPLQRTLAHPGLAQQSEKTLEGEWSLRPETLNMTVPESDWSIGLSPPTARHVAQDGPQ